MPRFINRKWIEVPEQSGSAEDRYKSSKQIRFKTSRLRSDLCDFSDAYIVVKGRVTANFNIRRVDFVNNDFPDALFSDNTFLEGSADQQKTTARNAAKTNAVITANAAADRRNLIKGFSFRNNETMLHLETMHHFSSVFQKLMEY